MLGSFDQAELQKTEIQEELAWVPQQREELMKEPRAAVPAGGAAAVVAAGTRLRLGSRSVGPRVTNKQQGPWTTFHAVSV